MNIFGTTASGRTVRRIELAAGDLSVSILTLGAIVQSVRMNGVARDLTLGSDKLADYEGALRHHGTLIGPVVNRLGGAQAPIAGKAHRFDANQDDRHTLHSGAADTGRKLWDVSEVGTSSAALSLDLPTGEGGFPGNRHVRAHFTLHAPATLSLVVTMTTDAPTLVNFANHSYWNLDGTARFDGHHIRIAADRYLPTTPDFTPTGEILPVAGTPYDLREGRELTAGSPPFDTNFCLSDSRQPLREVLWLTGQSGLKMAIATTEPGIQVYDARNAIRPGKAPYEGLAFEAQMWPDAPNHKGFPAIELRSGQTYRQVTEWRFSRG